MANNITSYGKIRYFEPNHILQDKLYGQKKTDYAGKEYVYTEPYNIPPDLEDYSIAVDLIVTTPKRIGDAYTETETHSISLTQNGDPVSFLGGTDGLMTDTPGTTTYYDILNKDLGGTQESLGITNIHITYNSYFYPQVTIKFTDIRGAALMMPHEEKYRRQKINEIGGNEHFDTTVENFFAALFSFPYPDFKLRVKGFYGKMVEYNLVVEDFRSSFNSQTGNFDATVKFIGKMYGVYTDIPMSYLLMAPYCRYGGTHNSTIWEQQGFQIEDGVPMPTLLEFKDKVLTAHRELATDVTYDKVQKYSAAQKRLSALSGIKSTYQALIGYFKKHYGESKTAGVILGSYMSEDLYLFKRVNGNCRYLYDNNSDLISHTQNLYDLITQYNESDFSNVKIPYLGTLTERNKLIGDGTNHPQMSFIRDNSGVYLTFTDLNDNNVFTKDLIASLWMGDKRVDVNRFKGAYPYLINGLVKFMRGQDLHKTIEFAALYCGDFAKTLNKIEIETRKEITDLQKQIDQEYGTRLASLIGFVPSIRNIFKVLMAHLQTFMEIYATFLNNVTGINTRKLSEYGLHFDETDVPDAGGSFKNTDLPPFPAIINTAENEFAYPTGIVSGVMEETVLIDSFFDGTFKLLSEKLESDKILESLNDTSVPFIPTCLTDFIILNNPYEHTFNNDDSTVKVDWIMSYLGLRSITYLMNERNTQHIKNNTSRLTLDEFGKCEAYNFWRTNKVLGKDIIEKIKSNDFNSKNYMDFLLGYNSKENPYIIDEKPCYTFINSNGEEQTNLIHESKSNPGLAYRCDSSRMAVPFAIGRDNGGFNTYVQDSDKSNIPQYSMGYTSTSKFSCYPYYYMQMVESDVLKSWDEQYNGTDLDEIIDANNKKKIFETLTVPYKDMFKKGGVTYKEEQDKESDFFLNYSDKKDVKGNLKTLSDFYNDNLNEKYILNDISIPKKKLLLFENVGIGETDVPIFFTNNLTAEVFLLSIPYDLEKLHNRIVVGRQGILLPYSTQLFLGMCIKKLKEGTITNKWLDSWVSKREDKLYLQRILYSLLLTEDFRLISPNTNSDNMSSDAIYSEWSEIQKKLKIDFLNLEKQYTDWANSNQPGGFLYFKEQYGFANKEGKTKYERLLNVCNSIKITSSEATYKEIQKAFDAEFKWVNRQGGDKATSSDFSERYSKIIYSAMGQKLNLGFNVNFKAYKHLYDFFTKHSILIIPFYMKAATCDCAKSTELTAIFNTFKNQLLKLYNVIDPETGEEIDYSDMSSSTVTEDSKLSMYLTLKNLQDKHFSNLHNEIEKYKVNSDIQSVSTEWDRFHFIDTFYNDIGDKLIINIEHLVNLLDGIIEGYESGTGEGIIQSQMSVYSFMSNLCQKNNMMLMAMPLFNGAFFGSKGEQNLADMFTPFPYEQSVKQSPLSGPSYVCFYPHQPSKHLDIPNSNYKNDGFSICDDMSDNRNFEDISGTANFLGPTAIPDLYSENEGDENLIIPAFGVEYGNQNQNIFKNINVNMDNPMVTEHSVAAQFNLAQGKQTEQRQLSFEGQNLFDVYSNHSYTCNVEMMGCSQIQPLMYFQLNNIPMFRGAYQIINVEHDITPGNMTTSFKGVRINKNKIPMVKDCINVNSLLENTNEKNAYAEAKKKTAKNGPVESFNLINTGSNGDGLNTIPQETNYTYEKCKTDLGKYFSISNMSTHTSGEASFNDGNPALRKLIYSIGKDMKQANMGIKITSMTRITNDYSPKSSSDHAIGKYNRNDQWIFNGSTRREQLIGLDGNGVEKRYSEMGCAVDLQGMLTNGAVDTVNVSVPLFHLIATNYTDNIRQLIWESKAGTSPADNNISNCIHLASYGKNGLEGNDKTEIFTACGNPWSATVANNGSDIKKAPTNIPPMFIKTLYDMSKAGKLTANVSLPNFTKANIKQSSLTTELLESWCIQLNV